jgi:hypothetical protein
VEEESAIEELLADLTDFSRLHTTTNEKTRHPHDTP